MAANGRNLKKGIEKMQHEIDANRIKYGKCYGCKDEDKLCANNSDFDGCTDYKIKYGAGGCEGCIDNDKSGNSCLNSDIDDDGCHSYKPREIFEKPKAESEGVKYDDGKPMWDLLPFDELEEVVKVMSFVVQSGIYPIDNWKKVPEAKRRYFRALWRHTKAWWSGERLDSETGLSHLAHAICCLLFLMWFDNNEKVGENKCDITLQ